jgi:hypothetical protein
MECETGLTPQFLSGLPTLTRRLRDKKKNPFVLFTACWGMEEFCQALSSTSGLLGSSVQPRKQSVGLRGTSLKLYNKGKVIHVRN